MAALIEVSNFMPGYTLENILEWPLDVINLIYERVLKVKRNDIKMIEILRRRTNKELVIFNEPNTSTQFKRRAFSVNDIQKIPGVKYTRNANK